MIIPKDIKIIYETLTKNNEMNEILFYAGVEMILEVRGFKKKSQCKHCGRELPYGKDFCDYLCKQAYY